jgi:hypothetical protein
MPKKKPSTYIPELRYWTEADIAKSEENEFPRFTYLPPTRKRRRAAFDPSRKMRWTHSFIRRQLELLDIPTPSATAYKKGDSPLRNLEPHQGRRYIYVLDLRDAYSFVNPLAFFKLPWMLAFMSLPDSNYEHDLDDFLDFKEVREAQCSPDSLKRAILLHCFHDLPEEYQAAPLEDVQGVFPWPEMYSADCWPKAQKALPWRKPEEAQSPEGFRGLIRGGPAAPLIFNLYCEYVVDAPIRRLLKSSLPDYVFTRYGDDLAISSNEWISLEKRRAIRAVIAKAGFVINDRKTFYYDRQKTKGNVIIAGVSQRRSGQTNIPKRKRRSLEGLILCALQDRWRPPQDKVTDPTVVKGRMAHFCHISPKRLNKSEARLVRYYRRLQM